MKLVIDHTTYDALQRHLLGELVASVRDALRDAGIDDGALLYEATSGVAHTLAGILDGRRELYLDDREVIPVLTFAREREGGELIASDSGGSWLSDYVAASVDDHVSLDDDDGEFDESIDLSDDDER